MHNKLSFSGHDTFHCRLFWLKKGYDYITTKGAFKDDSGIELGVGRNMVNSIRFWLKSFGVVKDGYDVNPLYKKLLDNNGWDPYLENEATLQLLHYELCANGHSSIYGLIFRELRKVKPEFSKQHFINFVKDIDPSQNNGILEKDFSVFLRTYNSKEGKTKEDSYSGLMTELSLVKILREDKDKGKLYRIENNNQSNIPVEILLYCILSNDSYDKSISFKSLYSDKKGIGNIFCFDQDKLEDKLFEIAGKYDFVTYNSEAGIKELQFKTKPSALEILKSFYEK
ncbi:MAG: DUF4007 family protein [Bacteroidota bacterium]